MQLDNRISAAVGVFLIGAGAASSQTLSLFTLPEGNTIIQITDAVASNTGGGVSTADTRTAYYFAPDFGDPQPNFADYTGSAWPYIYAAAGVTLNDLVIDSGITAEISLLTNPNSAAGLQWILINGDPLYQFVNDLSSFDANGNFGPWFYVEADGTASQSRVPAPGAAVAFALAGAASMRRRR